MKLTPKLIYGLVACVLLVNALHVEHLPLWVSALSAMLLAWRVYLAWQDKPLPPRWMLPALVMGTMGGILISFHTLFGREAGVTMLVLLSAFKLLELRAPRDAMVVLYLACFVIITNFLYSQSMLTALLMMATLFAILATWIHMQATTLELRPRLRIAGVLLLQAIPLTLVLFVLFPRIQGPLWGLPQDAWAITGLDDRMSPGSVSKLTRSEAVAFRVNFSGKPPPRSRMYWRGPVLLDFDGHTWLPDRLPRAKPAQLDRLADAVDYTVTLEPHNKTWLFALEMPTQTSIPAGLTHDFQLQQKSPVNSRLRYGVRSHLGYRANAAEAQRHLLRALNFPRNLNPRAQQLAAAWRAESRDAEAVVRTALQYFNREAFVYTLEPPPLGEHEIDEFLFETRRGFCEHYASAFVFLMRAVGIPARVVTGYQGGEYNALGDYYIVRQSDAHAWAEVWLPERGWVRVDPTAAIAPQRVELGVAAAIPESESAALPLMMRTQSEWLLRLRFNLDTLTYRWNLWVLGYNPERQFALLTRLGMEEITWQRMAFAMLGGLSLLVGLLTLLMLRQLKMTESDEVQRLYRKFCRKLAKKGFVREPHEGPQDFAARVSRELPQHAPAIRDITTRYVALRYAGQAGAAGLHALRNAVRKF